MSSSDDGWLTTKKVGRDDKQIAADRKKAELARKNKKRAKKGLAPLKPKAQPKKRAARRRNEYESEESAWGSEEEVSEEEQEEEDVELSYEDSSEEDDDNGGSFLPQSKRKNARMKEPMLKAVSKAKAKNKRNGYSRKTITPSSSEEDNGSDHFSSDDNKFKHKPTAAARKKPAANVDFNSSSESEWEVVYPKKKKGATAKSKYFKPQNTNKYSGMSSDEEEEETPFKPKQQQSRRPKTAAAKKRAIEVDEEEDDKRPRKSIGDSSWVPEEIVEDDDDYSYEDDDVALQAALKASVKSASKQAKKSIGKKLKKLGGGSNNKRKKVHRNDSPASNLEELQDSEEEIASEPEQEAIDMAESSEEEEDDMPDDQDEYMDEDEREASEVLAAANDLSASVLSIMTSWASDLNSEEDSSDKKKLTVPQGMIVDGAIAMSTMRKRRNSGKSSSQHAWISNEVMKEVLPTTTLAEYQLVGLNWLAMLHSMTVKVAHRKDAKATNVNGILADEMGLGKTCQTIAFLAWLKHSRSMGGIKEVGEEVAKKGDDVSDDDASDAEADNDVDVVDVDATPKPASKKTKNAEDKDADVVEVDATPKPSSRKTKHAEVSLRTTTEEKSQDALPHLIIVPASVVSNWEREFQNFAPHMSVVKYHGTQDERAELKRQLKDYLPKHRKKNVPMIDVILAPITYFQKETSEDRDFLRRFNFDYLICDEGHLLKNAKGLRYKNIDRFRTRHRLLLTGTPIQNSPQELMALLCFLMPLFKKRGGGFDDDDDDGGESMLQYFVKLESDSGKQETSDEAAYRKLKQLFSPFVLRRRKKDVLSQIIPPKSNEVEFVKLAPVARSQYNSIVSAHLKAKQTKTKSVTDHLFTTLRKAAHHPHLLRTKHTSQAEISHLTKHFHLYGAFKGEGATRDKVAEELKRYSDFDIHLMALELLDEHPRREKDLARYLLTEEDLFASAKLQRLKEILPKLIDDGHKILLFSMWTSCLDLVSILLEQMNLESMRMDGSTPVSERQERIDKFNSDDSIPIFLLSTTACGMGLNLTAADTVIFHDICMNPFTDLQAEDRAHRIGQKRSVTVIKMVAKDTVDEDIYNMQERKVQMNAAIMETPSAWSKEEKKEKAKIMKDIMDRHQAGSKAAVVDLVEKENLAQNVSGDSAETEV